MNLLQLQELNKTVIHELRSSGQLVSCGGTLDALESRVNHIVSVLREKREQEGKHPWLSRLACMDNRIRTDALEYLDRDDISEGRKARIVRALHRLNCVLGSYRRFSRILVPLVEEVSERTGRAANILELASGSGEFTLAIARQIRERRLRASITGSDYVQTHVDGGNRLASERKLPARFERINAFNMSHIRKGQFDIVFIAQSIHHFTPGQLARMISEASRFATTAFVGIDGARGFPLLAFLPFAAALRGRMDCLHDATLTSRKFYSEPELALIAELAAPSGKVSVSRRKPGMSLLTVRTRSAL